MKNGNCACAEVDPKKIVFRSCNILENPLYYTPSLNSQPKTKVRGEGSACESGEGRTGRMF